MGYSKKLKELFKGITLKAEDLLLLEAFQVKYLPDRVPQKEFAALLRAYPVVHRFLISRYPPIEPFVAKILKENKQEGNKDTIDYYCREVLWEIADLIVYNKYPGLFNTNVDLGWDISDISAITPLKDKIVVDAGAGTGRLAFMAARYAKTVYAVEPASSFRAFIRDKARKEKVKNLFVTDGFLDSIPLPNSSVDLLMTSNAIGWNIEDELKEIERVLRPNASAIHLLRAFDVHYESPFHKTLISPPWNYSNTRAVDDKGVKLKYYKFI